MSNERESGVVEALSELRLQRVQRALAGIQSHSSDARSVAYGQRSSGGVREVTATERAIDAGAVGRGRDAWQRVAAVGGRERTVLVWLTDYAHCGDVATLADALAGAMAPADLVVARGVVEAQHAAAAKAAAHASTAHTAARRILIASRAPEALAGHLAARTAAEAAATRLHSAEAAVAAAHADLRAWGVAALLAAVVAFEATGRQREAA